MWPVPQLTRLGLSETERRLEIDQDAQDGRQKQKKQCKETQNPFPPIAQIIRVVFPLDELKPPIPSFKQGLLSAAETSSGFRGFLPVGVGFRTHKEHHEN